MNENENVQIELANKLVELMQVNNEINDKLLQTLVEMTAQLSRLSSNVANLNATVNDLKLNNSSRRTWL